MFFYCFFIFTLILFFADYRIAGKTKPKILRIFGIIFFVFLLVFRFDVGYDYSHYYRALYPTLNITEINKWEPMCRAICYFADYFHYPPLFFIITGLATSMLIFTAFDKYADFSVMAVLTYMALFFESSFGFVRQGLALALMLNGYKYLIDHKYIRYGLLCAIACTIHYSALVCLLFPLLYNFLSSFPRLIFTVIVLIVSFRIILDIAEHFSFYNSYITEDVQIKGGRFIRLSNILLLSVLYYFTKFCKEKNIYRRIIMIGFVGSVFPFLLGGHIGGRMVWYFMIYICVILPNVISQYKFRIRYIWMIGLVSLFLLTIYVSSGNKDKSPYTPYHTIFAIDLKNPSFK